MILTQQRKPQQSWQRNVLHHPFFYNKKILANTGCKTLSSSSTSFSRLSLIKPLVVKSVYRAILAQSRHMHSPSQRMSLWPTVPTLHAVMKCINDVWGSSSWVITFNAWLRFTLLAVCVCVLPRWLLQAPRPPPASTAWLCRSSRYLWCQ